MNKSVAMDDVGLCNCARCGDECIGEKTQAILARVPQYAWPDRARGLPRVTRRDENGRPYCSDCYDPAKIDLGGPVDAATARMVGSRMGSMGIGTRRKTLSGG